nr:hypothetical protein [Tanacetum cinerariifolium]
MCVCQYKSVVFGTTSERYHTLRQYHTCTPLQSTSDRAPFTLDQHQDSRPPSSLRWTVQELVAFFYLILKMNHIRMKDFDDFKCKAFQLDARADAQLFIGMGTSDNGIDQVASVVAGRSSSRGFHQSCHKFTLGIWALPMSSSFDDCAYSSRAISSSICRSAGVNEIDGLSLMSVVVQA